MPQLNRVGTIQAQDRKCSMSMLKSMPYRWTRPSGPYALQILQLTSIRTLDLSNTCLGSLPLGITAMTALQELQLGACSFKSVPAQLLRQLAALRDLDLSRNADLELQQLSPDDLAWLATGAPLLECVLP